MIRATRTELRRSTAGLAAPLLMAIGALHIGTIHDYWRGSLVLATHEMATGLAFLAPFAVAFGAMLGRRERRTRAMELLESTGRPGWQRSLPPAAAIGLAAAGAYLLVVAACAVAVGLSGGHLAVAGAVPPLSGALILTGLAWLGIAAGRAWPSPILPPVLAAGILVLPVLVRQRPDVYNRWTNLAFAATPGPATPWEAPTTAALLAHLALAAGLTTAGFLLIAGRSWRSRSAAGAALAAGLAGLVLIASPGAAGKWRLDPAAQRLVCADGTPEVCVTAAHRYLLADVVPDVRRALDALAVLPDAPTRAAEIRLSAIGDRSMNQWYRFTPDDEPGTVYFVLDPDYAAGRDPSVAERIAMGGGTYLSRCGPQNDVALSVTGAWLLGADDFRVWQPGFGYQAWDAIRPEIRQRLTALRALPEAEQLARVTAVRDAARRCAPDLMAPLTGAVAS
ncbi:hypothetical protein [Catenuloplanes atrovinosus]|uniref:Uncharacterized protein n=1 Tax=Catenuloplanes atrovinosus TaxID=137266 RepID=A0AAE3YNJ3_9ACTN|nr:hypothetical protein [Catenuloplanes atrovinosus]MDR7275478.1 hypothetical protein [Catenuloplanes atrovinosus]